ncbi:MAG: 4'-phosphopantetheinyl transferase superfamily protein [Clostridia bacterium]|nr:4'-phosphopantetheinyl transferase superfamily protein [Clostridia bacterium]
MSKKAYEFVIKKAKETLVLSAEPQLSKGENGKPFLKDYPDFHFNISHSEDLIAVAFSDAPVGVDIEKKRSVNLKIADRFFTSDEQKSVTDTDSFFYVWTRKEAILKQKGESLGNIKKYSVINNKNIKTFTADGFVLSVCSEKVNDFQLIQEENF